jgi:hypothetical protein
MAVTKRELEIAAHNQMFRAQRAEQKAVDTSHALNLLLNGSFDTLHTGLTEDGAVHEFLLGVVRNVPVTNLIGWPVPAGQTENRRIILWKTTFEPRGVYATVYHEPDFRALSNQLDAESAYLEALLKEVIDKIPAEAPYLIKPKSPYLA